MKRPSLSWLLAARLACAAGAAAPPLDKPPLFANEQLRYTVNWPSGLSLGETQLRASRSKPSPEAAGRLRLELTLQASVPGFQVLDDYKSEASADFCSLEFDKNTQHGVKKTEEKTTFDPQAGTAKRETSGGGKSELKAPSCAKDALTYFYFLRRELSQGRLPPAQTVFFGAPYDLRFEFKGTQSVRVGEATLEADRLVGSAKGPSSEVSFEIFLLKDAARTPVLARVPLPLGTFSMELVR